MARDQSPERREILSYLDGRDWCDFEQILDAVGPSVHPGKAARHYQSARESWDRKHEAMIREGRVDLSKSHAGKADYKGKTSLEIASGRRGIVRDRLWALKTAHLVERDVETGRFRLVDRRKDTRRRTDRRAETRKGKHTWST